MSSIVIELLCAGLAAVVGLTAGWWLRGGNRSRPNKAKAKKADDAAATPAAPPPAPATPAEEEKKETSEERAIEILARLQEVTVGMAAQVDSHSMRVREINEELASHDATEPSVVMSAMAKLVDANKRMQMQLAAAEKKLEKQSKEIEAASAEALTDALTQLANRRAFDRAMQRAIGELQERGRPMSLLILDVDHFKKFNDTHGHQTGDEVLRGVGEVLRKRFRGAELVARYGGEEFAVIFPGDALGGVRSPAELARRAIADSRFTIDGVELRVTASGGLAEAIPGEEAEAVIKRADEALYASKKAGRNCGHWHDGKMTHRLSEAGGDMVAPLVPSVDGRAPHCDALTGLSTPVNFVEDVKRRLAEVKRYDTPLSVILLQLDDHDQRIEKRGLKTASLVVKTAAQFLRAAMRDMDHVARYNDDTFALLLPTAELDDAVKVGERLRQAIARCAIGTDNDSIQFTVCVGVAQAERKDETLRLLRRAQTALGMARNRGTNLTALHDGRDCRLAPPAETPTPKAVGDREQGTGDRQKTRS